jgi:hypothetical protein
MGPFKLSLTKREGWNFENFEKSDYSIKPFLRFVGTILKNWIAKIPGQPRFCVKRVFFFVSFNFPEKGKGQVRLWQEI